MKVSRRAYIAIAFKLAATVALLWFVLSRVNFAEMMSRLHAERIALALAAGALVIFLQSVVAAIRLQICLGLLGARVSRFNTWTACQFGGLFSHTPMSFVGGDAMRIWHVVRSGVQLADAAKGVLLDRALGFVGMMIVVLGTAAGFHGAIRDPALRSGYFLLLALGSGAALTFIVLGRMPLPRSSNRVIATLTEFATVSRYLWLRGGHTATALTLAVVMSLMNAVAIWLIGLAYGARMGFLDTMIASPIVFLVAMVPISVAGWGLREGAFVVALGLFAVPSADALAVSVTFGIAVLLAYSPAVVLLLRARHYAAHATKEAGYVPASSRPTARS